jgi:APA family basic amino acid/polyamine antiporter
MWVTFASGYQVVYQALVVILVGLVLYAFLNARRQRLGEAVEPTDFTTEAAAAELVGSE